LSLAKGILRMTLFAPAARDEACPSPSKAGLAVTRPIGCLNIPDCLPTAVFNVVIGSEIVASTFATAPATPDLSSRRLARPTVTRSRRGAAFTSRTRKSLELAFTFLP
jgi:hypothetical protein